MQTFKEVRDELEEQVRTLRLITISQAAEIRKVSRSAILQLIQRGRLKTEMVLGRHLIYQDEVENFAEQKPGPTPNTIFERKSN